MKIEVDIKENNLLSLDHSLLEIILIDRTLSSDTEKHNIIWATDNYLHLGEDYSENSQITVESITGDNGLILRPRINKSKEEQEHRSRDKAEVFTPAWICNCQNNLIDKEWFEGESPFNTETENGWITKTEKITFPNGKTWEDYVSDNRLEMTCGEATPLAETVIKAWEPYKDRLHTITADNGKEFAKHKEIAKGLDVKVFYITKI